MAIDKLFSCCLSPDFVVSKKASTYHFCELLLRVVMGDGCRSTNVVRSCPHEKRNVQCDFQIKNQVLPSDPFGS